MVKDCIFCSIANGSAPSYKVYEDKMCVAVLDIFPNIKGQTVVITKKHCDSYAFSMKDKELSDFIISVKNVAKLLEERLEVGRVHMALEGTGVNHLHAKLYPAMGCDRKFKQAIAEERVFFKCYPGYVTTLMGPKADDVELRKLKEQITKAGEDL
jgi:diadenosine tetraphosphate (Ap4A) HIT family hydrolase